MDYLPEWKIYLWKKLLLEQSSAERVFQPSDFIYFDEKAQVGVLQRHAQRSINRLHWVENTAYSAALSGNKVRIDSTSSTPIPHQYYHFEPQEVMLALIELADTDPTCLEIEDIEVRKGLINKYRQERTSYLTLHEKRRLASITMTHGGGGTSTPDNRYTDPFCGLPESVYKKVESAERLTVAELKDLVQRKLLIPAYPSLYFKIRIDKEKLLARLNVYLDDFMEGKLIPPKGVRYFRFEEQKKNILLGAQSLVAEYGNNTPITFEEVAKRGGWENKDEDHYRFYETIFALEKLEEIRVTDLRGDEVIISIVEAGSSDHPAKELSAADTKRLLILEKLKDEWDLVPKQNSGPSMLQAGVVVFNQRAGEVRIHERRFRQWLADCGIDFYQLQDILTTFQQEGLITRFSLVNEAR
jgi:hypothetical protein